MTWREMIHDYVIHNGWLYKGKCNCGGMPTYKYTIMTNSGEYRLKVRASTYLLSKPGERYYKRSNNELKKTIDEIIQAQNQIQVVPK